MIEIVRQHVMPAAFALLPEPMRAPEATCVSGTISGAERRYQRRAAPHHIATVGGGHAMADQDSIRPVARSSNGTPLFRKECPNCGRVSIVDKRKLGRPCHPCAMKARRTHGLTGHPLYRLLNNMRARCEYQTATHYAYYGARGIKVCEEWRADPRAFVAWAQNNGWAPGLEIDRIDPDGDYEPSNCRFLSHLENSRRNRSASLTREKAREVKALLAAGVSTTDVARHLGVGRMAVEHIRAGRTWKDV